MFFFFFFLENLVLFNIFIMIEIISITLKVTIYGPWYCLSDPSKVMVLLISWKLQPHTAIHQVIVLFITCVHKLS